MAEIIRLNKVLRELNISLDRAVDFLETLNVPAYKIASFELIDLPLIRYVASKGKPMIMSTGMSTLDEIDAAVKAAQGAGAPQVSVLRCNSTYPANSSEMDLAAIPAMIAKWGIPVGLSDHTMGIGAAVASVALGATVIEKHFTLDRTLPGPDHKASLEPEELKSMIAGIRNIEEALGESAGKTF